MPSPSTLTARSHEPFPVAQPADLAAPSGDQPISLYDRVIVPLLSSDICEVGNSIQEQSEARDALREALALSTSDAASMAHQILNLFNFQAVGDRFEADAGKVPLLIAALRSPTMSVRSQVLLTWCLSVLKCVRCASLQVSYLVKLVALGCNMDKSKSEDNKTARQLMVQMSEGLDVAVETAARAMGPPPVDPNHPLWERFDPPGSL
jgi:hypothetical protein